MNFLYIILTKLFPEECREALAEAEEIIVQVLIQYL
jgi:hypothetical protein